MNSPSRPIPAHPDFLHHPWEALSELVVDLCSSLVAPCPPEPRSEVSPR